MPDEEDLFNFDLEQMKKAVESPTIRVPDYVETIEDMLLWLENLELEEE